MQPVQDWTASNPTDNVYSTRDGDPNLDQRASGIFAVGSESTVWLGGPGFTVPATKADGNTEGNVFGFVSVWTAESNYTQSVTLAPGSYTITIPTYNGGGTGTIEKNLCGFIADDGTEHLATTVTFSTLNTWQNETIKFSLEEETSGIITIGYKAANKGSADMPHLFIDEFTLMFNGVTDIAPSLLALQSAIRTAQSYEYYDNGIYEATLNEQLLSAIEAGEELVSANSADDEANVAATTALNAILSEIRTSVASYNKFKTFLDEDMAQAVEKYSNDEELSDLGDELADLMDEYKEGYEAGEYTTEQIEAAISDLDTRVVAAVTAALAAAAEDGEAHNIDITCLYDNLDYANSTVTNWQNETGTTAFLSRVQTAEVWGQTAFNVYQVLTNLPAGAYEIKANGFYRTASNLINYTYYTDGNVPGTAYLYAGGNSTLIHNVAEYASETQDDYHTGVAVEESLYVPNDNNSAHYLFYDLGEAENSVTVALAEAGDLTVGMKAADLESDSWVVWGAFTVTYKGTDGMNNALYQELMNLASEAVTLQDEASSVAEADNKINDALGVSEGLSATSSVEELTEGIKTMKEAIAYATESKSLMETLEYNYTIYSDYLVAEIESEEETFPALLDEIASCIEDGYESNEQIEQYIKQLKKKWATYVQYPTLETSSEENAGEITKAMLNANFEGVYGSAVNAYWNITRDGGTEGGNFNAYEMFNNNSFEVSQTVEGLAPGYYRVRMQGYYRAGTNEANVDSLAINPEYGQNAVLFAGDTQWTPVCNVLTGAVTEATGANGEKALTMSDESTIYVPNSMESASVYFTNDTYWNQLDVKVGEDGSLTFGVRKNVHIDQDWTIWNKFELYYLGTTAPTAVESIAVEGQNANGVAGKMIYSIDGTRLARMQKGVNIIKTTLSDGTVKTAKVLVK